MKWLCVKQPWANWIANGMKPIETRTWATRYRGPLTIVASRTVDRKALKAMLPGMKLGPFGLAICTCTLVDVKPMVAAHKKRAMCELYEGFSWFLEDVKAIAEPYPVRGQLGIFSLKMKNDVAGAEEMRIQSGIL